MPEWRRLLPHVDGWRLSTIGLAVLLLVPLGYLLVQLVLPASEAWQHVAEYLLPGYAWNTIKLLCHVFVWTLILAVVPAWLVSAYDFPGRRGLAWLLATPLAVPGYIAAFAWAGLFDYAGPVQGWVRSVFGNDSLTYVPDITDLPGVGFVLATVLFPYVYVSTRASLLLQSGTHVEAARSMGIFGLRLFYRVVLPALRPAIVAGLALVGMETINDYGAVHYYGVDTMTTGIFRAFYALGDRDAAVRIAGILLLGAFFLFTMERLSRGRRKFDAGGTTRFLQRRSLKGILAFVASGVCWIPVILGLVIPVLMLLWWSSHTFSKVWSSELWTLALRSGMLALAGATLVVFLSLLFAYVARFRAGRGVAGLVGLAGSGYAVPGAVIAVGVTSLASILDRLAYDYYVIDSGLLIGGTVIAMLWAYSVRFLAVGIHPIDAAFVRGGERLDEAGLTLGHRPSAVLTRIHLPVIKGTLVGAAMLVFVDILKELPLTLILRPFDFDTLATHTFQLASEEMVPESAPSALILVGFGLVAVWIANRFVATEEMRHEQS